MITISGRSACRAGVVLGVILLAACKSGETIAPDASTITLTANPANIVLGAGGVQTSPVAILATVRNSIGVPLPKQDVRFTTSSGFLDPEAGTPVATDDNGNAICTLDGAAQGPTITATSGKATATLTLTAATGLLSTIVLNTSSTTALINCSTDSFSFTATANDPGGTGIKGVPITFSLVQDPTAPTPTWTPGATITSDVNGNAATALSMGGDCQSKCSTGAGNNCKIVVQAQSGTVKSNLVTIVDQVP